MEREPYLTPALERHEHLQELAPPRDIHWGVETIHQEAIEVKESDYVENTKEFQKELADVQIALWTVLALSGISIVEFYERILPNKEDQVIQRLQDAFILSRGGAMTFQDAYDGIKSLETDR